MYARDENRRDDTDGNLNVPANFYKCLLKDDERM